MDKALRALPGIGPMIEAQLEAVGIDSPEKLRAVGAKEAWSRILAIDSSACYNRLTALQGAAQGVQKKMLSQETRADLKAFYRQAKGK